VLFYLLVYGVATVGAFGIVWLVRERTAGDDDADPSTVLGEATHLSQWAGLGRTHPDNDPGRCEHVPERDQGTARVVGRRDDQQGIPPSFSRRFAHQPGLYDRSRYLPRQDLNCRTWNRMGDQLPPCQLYEGRICLFL